MTRDEFIQHAVLAFARAGSTQEHAIEEAVRLALKVSERTKWTNPGVAHERVALLMVESAARESGASSHDLDAALARLDELRKEYSPDPISVAAHEIIRQLQLHQSFHHASFSQTFPSDQLPMKEVEVGLAQPAVAAFAGRELPTPARAHEIIHELRLHLSFHRASFSHLIPEDELPKTEAEVDGFIARRTKLWRTSWIFPLLDELDGVDPVARSRAASDPSFRCSRCGAAIVIGGEGDPELCSVCCDDDF